jgi:hypothetical protein
MGIRRMKIPKILKKILLMVDDIVYYIFSPVPRDKTKKNNKEK